VISAVHVIPTPVLSVCDNYPFKELDAGYPGYSATENAGLMRTAVVVLKS
jgi:hypothetical protein